MVSPDREEPFERLLERLLADAEVATAKLRQELEEMREHRSTDMERLEQHIEIDRLREHLADAQVHWSEVRDFFDSALKQLYRREEPGSD